MRATNQSLLVLAAIVQVTGMTLIAVASYTTVYFTMAALLIAGATTWDRRFILNPSLLCLLAAFAAIALTLPFVWHTSDDLLVLVILLPVLGAVVPPLLARFAPDLFSPMAIGLFCLTGAIGALIFGLNDVFVLHLTRAGVSNNPIHYAGLSVLLGFSALIGLFGSRSQWRFLFLLAPLFGTGAAFLSGSRGPVLAAAVLTVAVAPFLLWWFWRQRGMQAAIAGVLVLLVAGALFVPSSRGINRAFDTFGDIVTLAQTGDTDSSTAKRLVMYNGAIGAFFDAPFAGHGLTNMISAAQVHEPPKRLVKNEHLHSDIADFAVMGGVLGLLGYAFLLLAPFATLRKCPPDRRRTLLLFGLIISLGYFTLGLTNAVIGVLPQTLLYGLLLGNAVALKGPSGDATES